LAFEAVEQELIQEFIVFKPNPAKVAQQVPEQTNLQGAATT
jgi:hypothetical protein